MTTYRYYCIICHFICNTVKPWEGRFYECPSCHKQVELRALPPIVENEVAHVIETQIQAH